MPDLSGFIAASKSPIHARWSMCTRVLIILLWLWLPIQIAWAEQKPLIGWIEHIHLPDQSITLKAKVDTGADSSSIHADILRYEAEGEQQWVVFLLRAGLDKAPIQLRKPVLRISRIKKKTQGVQVRPVVNLNVCLDGKTHEVEFNLAQRAHMKVPVLLGRKFLANRFWVDSGRKHLLTSSCD